MPFGAKPGGIFYWRIVAACKPHVYNVISPAISLRCHDSDAPGEDQKGPARNATLATGAEGAKSQPGLAALWLAVSLSLGQPIASPIEPFDYTGKIALRIPRSLHSDVAELAQLQGCSVNQLLAVAISAYVGRQGLPQVNGYLASK
jgi:hypothetical protein